MNLMPGEVAGETFTLSNGFALTVEEAKAAGRVTLGVPTPTIWCPPRPRTPTRRWKLIELLGPRAIVTIDARGTVLTSVVQAAQLAGIAEGARVTLSARPGGVHVFDTQTGRLVGAASSS